MVILRRSRLPSVREHVEEFVFGFQIAESVKEIDEVVVLIESVSSCTAENRVEDAAGFAAVGTAEEETVFATDGGRSQHAFGFIVVDDKSAIGTIHPQCCFMIQRILTRKVQGVFRQVFCL